MEEGQKVTVRLTNGRSFTMELTKDEVETFERTGEVVIWSRRTMKKRELRWKVRRARGRLRMAARVLVDDAGRGSLTLT